MSPFHYVPPHTSFALIEKNGIVTRYLGEISECESIDDLHRLAARKNKNLVFLLPFNVIRERGFESLGQEPILALTVDETTTATADECKREFPRISREQESPVTPSIDDADQMELLRRFQTQEIEGGNVSQVNLSRIFRGKLKDCSDDLILSVFRSLLGNIGQYMTILICDRQNGRYFVGATPECHVEIGDDHTLMTPIAGTLRKEDGATFEERLQAFLSDPKERNELYQVTDEELKMMARISPSGGRIEGPFLKETGNVVHTYYKLLGKRSDDTPAALRHTLHAPTVVGSPMESAARVICRYEPESRRYYGGEIGIYDYLGRKEGAEFGNMDVAIFIRCAEIEAGGEFRLQAGGGIVRDSDPLNETKENYAKASVMMDALLGDNSPKAPYLTQALRTKYADLLEDRNRYLSPFWFREQSVAPAPGFKAARITVINNEDDFACMIVHVLKSMGHTVSIVDTFDYDAEKDVSDVVAIGPGPGDVNDASNPRMVRLLDVMRRLKSAKKPQLGICLGHQALCMTEGIPVIRLQRSFQGEQRQVPLYGERYRLGFYNSFSSKDTPELEARRDLRIHSDEGGHIIAMEGENFVGYQFHPESVMSERGRELLARAVETLTR